LSQFAGSTGSHLVRISLMNSFVEFSSRLPSTWDRRRFRADPVAQASAVGFRLRLIDAPQDEACAIKAWPFPHTANAIRCRAMTSQNRFVGTCEISGRRNGRVFSERAPASGAIAGGRHFLRWELPLTPSRRYTMAAPIRRRELLPAARERGLVRNDESKHDSIVPAAAAAGTPILASNKGGGQTHSIRPAQGATPPLGKTCYVFDFGLFSTTRIWPL